jgi:uncharacterized repeat protein (TIGR03803 family)
MTTSGICELFGFARPSSQSNGSARITSRWKVACALLLLCAATAIASQAQTLRTVALLDGTTGTGPWNPPIQGLDGNFYGTAVYGGDLTCSLPSGCGTVFKVTRGGKLTVLHSFGDTDGGWPSAGLLQATDGNFYGTTVRGGANDIGTVFKITPDGTLTTLHSFNGSDGANPYGSLIQATDGNFYGTTLSTIFKITPGGTLTTLHSLPGPILGGLVQATDGNFYGTTAWDGANRKGTIFEITPSGTLTTLYNFCAQTSCTDGSMPYAGLAQATDGNFYGTTFEGGANDMGAIFKITPSGVFTTLHSFDGTDGARPTAPLIQATDGSLYGSAGTIFRITPRGALTTLNSFAGGYGGLIQATDGTFYWATGGSIYSLCVGLGWFTEELPSYGKVGDTIDILGTDLTGASYVTFDGTPAPFTVISPTLIQATVPAGAGTGYVRVTLPSGRIPSNKKFRVLPQITSFTPTDGPVGTVVTIMGVSLTQTWEVTIRGVHASFTVVDDTTVTATVPTGATTGEIRISGPGGAATSTTDFTVD